MDAATNDLRIRFQEVVQVFRVERERPTHLREAFARLRLRSQASDFQALRGLSFQVHSGETLGIIGANGSGKSTTLKLIAGVYEPTAGVIEVRGEVSPLIELTAGFHPELTGRENVFLTGALLGVSRKFLWQRFDSIVAFAELGEFIDTPLRQYSQGMQMRLGFSVAIAIERPILVIDEVLAVGDEAFQRRCVARLEDFHRQGGTIVFVSHDMTAVERICQRVLLLNQGTILAEGSPGEVIQRYYELVESPSPPATGQAGSR